MADLIYSTNVNATYRAAFIGKVKEIAAYLQVDPNWLMQVMKAESGLNPQAQNKSRTDGHLIAAGLIQWTKASGQDPVKILQLTALQQLDLVQKYFAPYRGKMKSYFDVYLVTFFPAAVGKADSYIFQTSKYSPALIAAQNPAINKNKDAQITMAEFKNYVFNSVPATLRDIVFSKVAAAAVAGSAGILIAIGFFF